MRFSRLLHVSLLLLAGGGAAAGQTTALVGGRIIDGTGRVIERGTLVITGDRIEAIGPATMPVPAGATRIDVSGKTVLPGIVNAHGHVAATSGLRTDPSFYTRDNLLRQLRTYARYGVTTVFSLGDDDAEGFRLRDENMTALDRAKMFLAGPVIVGATADEARAMANRVADMKPDLLKIRIDDNLGTAVKMPDAAWHAVIDVAKARHLPLAVHVFYLADARAALQAGAGMIAHSVRDQPVDAAFINALKSRDVCYVPTLTRELSTFAYESTPPWADDPFFLIGAEKGVREQLKDSKWQQENRNSPAAALGRQYKAGLEVAKKNLQTLVESGARIAMGTDSGPPGRFQGFFEHLEMEMMVDAGMTPMQAIVAATGDAARCHGRSGRFGTIAANAAADLLILDANPLDDIRNTRRINAVWINGKKAY